MALPKDAVSVEGTRLNNKSMTLVNSHQASLQSTKKFRKNAFLSALLLGNFFVAEHALALSVQPIQVKSAMGEPFRAQLVITDIAGIDPSTIRASLASDSEFIQLGINKRNLANDLRFTTTITSPERGIISITSDHPLNDPYIEFVVHIGFGHNVRLQQVTALVDPPLTRIQTESLNLPIKQIQLAETAPTPTVPAATPQPTTNNNPNVVKVTSSVTSRTVQLIPSTDAPPPMDDTPLPKTKNAPSTAAQVNTPLIPKTSAPPPMAVPKFDKVQTAPATTPAPMRAVPATVTPTPAPVIAPTPVTSTITPAPAPTPVVAAPTPVQAPTPAAVEPAPVQAASIPTAPPAPATPVAHIVEAPPAASPTVPTPDKPAQSDQPVQTDKKSYTVQRHDSLWAIASRMQKDMNIPVTVIMHSIQQNNQSAFIHGNPNHIRSGATIVLPNQQDISQSVQPDLQKIKVENDDVENNKTPTIRSLNQQANETKTPYIRRGHLPDAKMTLVAPTQDGSAQGSATEGQSDAKQHELSEINLKITTARQQNITLSQEVSELEAKIKANDQKLALQNAKLAELMQRLKNRKDTAPQNANRTQNHE